MRKTWPNTAAANSTIALWLQSTRRQISFGEYYGLLLGIRRVNKFGHGTQNQSKAGALLLFRSCFCRACNCNVDSSYGRANYKF
jgi:hypothetical protein